MLAETLSGVRYRRDDSRVVDPAGTQSVAPAGYVMTAIAIPPFSDAASIATGRTGPFKSRKTCYSGVTSSLHPGFKTIHRPFYAPAATNTTPKSSTNPFQFAMVSSTFAFKTHSFVIAV